MSDLCCKCKEKWNHIGWEAMMPFGILHCHHEEKTKPSCWCDLTSITRSVDSWVPGGWQSWRAKFCPVCGKKLEG
jgi:hypothetical protein